MNARFKITCLALLVILFLGSGCVPIAKQFNGNRVTSAPVAALVPSGSQAGTWQTFDISIEYQYRRSGDNFEISGTAALSQHYEIMYAWLNDLKVYLFFLDKDQRVLDTSMIARSLTGQLNQQMDFKQTFKLPPGTTSISFGYEGLVREGRRDWHTFYQLPLSKD